MKAKEGENTSRQIKKNNKNPDLDGAVKATLERPEIKQPMKAVNEWLLNCCCAQKYHFKVVVALPGSNVVNTFQNLPLFSTTEQNLKGWAMFCVAHWATVTSWAALLLSQCAVCEWCVKAWKYSDTEVCLFFSCFFMVCDKCVYGICHFPKIQMYMYETICPVASLLHI